jgi:hypothetical protein
MLHSVRDRNAWFDSSQSSVSAPAIAKVDEASNFRRINVIKLRWLEGSA